MKNPEIQITHDILMLIAEIDEFKGRWEARGARSAAYLQGLKRSAMIASIGSSARIDGAELSDERVEAIISQMAIPSFESWDHQEVAGYAQAMNLVFEGYPDMSLTETQIRRLHEALLSHSSGDESAGSYKTSTNHLVSFDLEGQQTGILFETTTPFATPAAMDELTTWTLSAEDEGEIHPLLIIAVFVLQFLAIHPFQGGSGRLSRILTKLLMLRAGYLYVPYVALESVVEQNKDLYYRALAETQSTFGNDQPDWTPWIGFFLRCLKLQKDRLERTLGSSTSDHVQEDELPLLSIQILALMDDGRRQTISGLVDATGANRNTLKVRLRELVSANLLRRHGSGRSTWYTRARSE